MMRILKFYRFHFLVFVIPVLSCIFLAGCQTTKSAKTQRESTQEMNDSLRAVAGAIKGGQSLSEEEFKELQKQVATDEEAMSAVESISQSMSAPKEIKYCPIDGERFSPHLITCPTHSVELKILVP